MLAGGGAKKGHRKFAACSYPVCEARTLSLMMPLHRYLPPAAHALQACPAPRCCPCHPPNRDLSAYPLLRALTERELPVRRGSLATIVFLRDRNPKGQVCAAR